ncbi:MAG: mono/diheme cytochrome c family protein [Verrucomicrobiales bacterium]|jgi:mono/diheme cytochrome c family protein
MNFWLRIGGIFSLLAALFGSAHAVDFETEVLPIFKTHCFECHGPETQKSGFRLDLRSAAMTGGTEGVAILPNKPDESPLIQYIGLPKGDDLRMPPKGAGLAAAEILKLREWVASGANWPDSAAGEDSRLAHWAWQPIRAEASAALDIDHFISATLKENGLTLSPEADRRTLIRRLSFDLHGLPPATEAVERFLNDPDPQAYEKLVDQMLSSTHFGERFAQHWLDIAHYADTHGFERDKRRDSAWRYRDYVIAAFNEDKPYDRFLKEQIAGDVFWPDDEAATIATGFLAAGPWDFVGQKETKSPVLRRSARALDLDDMATQVMTSTVGLTVNCARCHDHKLDPISQEEYYQLLAVFAGVNRDERITSGASKARYDSEKAALSKQLNETDFEIGRIEGSGLDLADIVGGGNGLGTGAIGQGLDARTAQVQTRKFGALGNVKANHFSKSSFDFVDGVFIPDGGDGTAKIPVSSTGVSISGLPKTSVAAWDMIRNGPVASQHSTEHGDIDFTKDGHSLLGLHANAGITFDLAAMRKSTGEGEMKFTTRLGYFGASGGNRADVWIFLDGVKVAEFKQLKRDDGLKDVELALPAAAGFLTLIATDGGNGYGMDQIGFGDPKIRAATPRDISVKDRARLAELGKKKAESEAKLKALGTPPKFYGVVAEKEMPAVRIQRRGDPENEFGDPVTPGAVALLKMLDPALGDHKSSEFERRKALANWITHLENPLTARVIVNRLWYWHFGQGIVSTPSDFGFGGGHPSHPELLDWLAAELPRQKWSLKTIHRLILTSRTYKQDSRYAIDAAGISVDAGNRLLWRQNPRRVDAETVRDSVLFVSGKLNIDVGGPGFEDFKFTDAYAPIYDYFTADEPEFWRRSIYRYVVRTTPDQFLTTLDCPDPANFTPTRQTTTTPLQSLALYNNEFMLRQARYLAERIEAESGVKPDEKVKTAFEILLGRPPSSAELPLASEFIESKGLFSFCRSLLNANEFVFVD